MIHREVISVRVGGGMLNGFGFVGFHLELMFWTLEGARQSKHG